MNQFSCERKLNNGSGWFTMKKFVYVKKILLDSDHVIR